jgi:hypothetical protein
VHYARVAGLWSGYLGVLFYALHRAVEYWRGFTIQWLAPSFYATAACFAVVTLLGFLNSGSHHRHRLGGVWSRFREAGKDAATSKEAQASHVAVFESRVCAAGGNALRYSRSDDFKESQINLLDARIARGLLARMDDLVLDKLTRFMVGDSAPAGHVDGVITAMQSYFQNEFCGTNSCEVRRFDTLEQVFQHYRVNGSHRAQRNDIEDDLDQSDFHICSSGGPGRGLLDAAGGSLVIAPVRLATNHLEALARAARRHRVGRRRLTLVRRGYIVLRSGDHRSFTESKKIGLRLALTPFVHRLTYEIMRNELSQGGRS